MCEAHAHHAAATTPEEATAECPVMRGNFVDKETAASQGLTREHEGQTYYLCCAACGPLFDADPERYLAAA